MKFPVTIHHLTPTLRTATQAALVDDGHGGFDMRPTHCFLRQGEVVGAVSLFAPVILFWSHSKRMHPRESIGTIRECQRLAASQRPDNLVLCNTESPFHPLMPRLGYRNLGSMDVFEPK